MAHRVSSQAVADLAAFGITLPRKAAASKRPTISLIRSRIGSFYYPDIRTSDVLARKILGIGFRTFPVGEYLVVYCIEGGDVLGLRITGEVWKVAPELHILST